MELIVITTGSYPYGGAATNRHLSYLKGLVNLNVQIKLFILHSSKNHSLSSDKPFGNFEGIEYEYLTWVNWKKLNLSKKIVLKIVSHYKAIVKLYRVFKNDNNNCILLVLLTEPFDIFPYLKLADKYKIKKFHERTEYPFLGVKNKIDKFILKFYLHQIVPKFDGIFVISKELVKYFSNYIEKNKILHLPMTVDFERFTFSKLKGKSVYGNYIAYCGSMYTDKDGVPILIDSFNIVAEKIDDINLLLIGENEDKKLFSHIERQIYDSQYSNRILLTGWVERNQIPNLLFNARLLVLARPNNIQAKAGFPTKLGEYLATGKPVVITDVGEHTDYLKDGYSAFIARPDDPINFAEKILEALNDPVRAMEVGRNGKNIALNYFNYKTQAILLYNFLNAQVEKC